MAKISPLGIKLLQDFKRECLLRADAIADEFCKAEILRMPGIAFDVAVNLANQSLIPGQIIDAKICEIATHYALAQVKHIERYDSKETLLVRAEKIHFNKRMVNICKGNITYFADVKSHRFFKKQGLKARYCRDLTRLSDPTKALLRDEIFDFWEDLELAEDIVFDARKKCLIPISKK